MNELEYQNEIAKIEREARERKSLVAKKYALANTTVKIGDVIEDHIGRIKVESIKTWIGCSSNFPSCVFVGTVVNKDGSFTKKKDCRRDVYQSNLKRLV